MSRLIRRPDPPLTEPQIRMLGWIKNKRIPLHLAANGHTTRALTRTLHSLERRSLVHWASNEIGYVITSAGLKAHALAVGKKEVLENDDA